MQATMKFWDGIAEKYAKSPIKDMQSYEYSLDRTRSYLKPTDTVLELGCGTGSTALKLSDRVAQITASDISGAMLAVGKRNAALQGVQNVTFVQADIDHIPKGPFDVIMAFNLLHLIRDLDSALANIRPQIKPGGLFISKTPCNPERRAPLGYRLIRLVLPLIQLVGKAPHVNFMDVRAWDAKVTAAGFDIIESGNHPANPPARYLVARKR